MFLVDDVPYLIDKAEQSTLYRFPELDPGGHRDPGEGRASWPARWPTSRAPTCPPTGALLAVDTHTTLYVYQAADPSLPGPRWWPT